jgi:adenosine kinase
MLKKVVVTGSLSFDTIMSMPGRFRDHILPDKLHIINVSFIMETYRKEFGGTGGNIAYNLALLGYRVKLVGAAGNDFSTYKAFLKKQKNLDISGVRFYKNVATANGFAMTDQDDNQIWGFFAGAMKYSQELPIKQDLNRHTFLVVAPNDVRAMMIYTKEAKKAGAEYLFDPAFNIPHFAGEQLRQAVYGAKIVIGNDYEISLLKKKLGWNLNKILEGGRLLVTTLGAEGSIIQKINVKLNIPAAKPKNTVDPTGAGDAYRAGFLAGYLREFPLSYCGRMGSVCAAYTVEKYGTQTHKFTSAQFERRYSENFGEQLTL